MEASLAWSDITYCFHTLKKLISPFSFVKKATKSFQLTDKQVKWK